MSGYWLQIMQSWMVNCVLALGLFVSYKAGILSVGHATFMGVGAYTAALLTTRMGLPIWVTLPAAGVAGLLSGYLAGVLIGTRLNGLYLAIGTVAFTEGVVLLFTLFPFLGGPLGISGLPHLGTVTPAAVLLLVLAGLALFERSVLARAFRAVHDDPVAARVVGIPVERVKVLAFALGAGITGIGGALHAFHLSTIQPYEFGFVTSVDLLIAVLVGGAAVPLGTVLGAAIISVVPELLRQLPVDRFFVYGLILMVTMAFRQEGLLTHELLRHVWRKGGQTPDLTGPGA